MARKQLFLLPALLCLAAGAAATSVWAAPQTPGGLSIQRESASGIGENLIPNGSFESVAGNLPARWRWDRRNTDAACAVVPEGHSGKNAVRITNGTPFGAHIYGQLVLEGGVALTPGETYTLSLYVKSQDPGHAWTGGGDGWWMRLGLEKTGNQWRRFSTTFTARDKDRNFSLMINTDSPTPGFLVDDIKLEKGDHATPYLDPALAKLPVSLILDAPPQLSNLGQPVSLSAYACLQADALGIPATLTLRNARGAATRAVTAEPLQPGINRLTITWQPQPADAGPYRLTLAAGPATEQAAFTLYSRSQFTAAAQTAQAREEALRALRARAAKAGIPTDYARAALAICERFRAIAGQKCDAGLIPEAIADAEFLASLCREQAKTLQAQLAGKRPPLAVPDPPLAGLTIHDGNFWAGKEPVMLLGALGYNELEKALPTYRDYGFNVIGDDFDAFSALNMVTGENQYDETVFPRLKANWERLNQMNLAVAYNPTLHYFPEWALKRYPDITGGDPVDCLPDWSGMGRHAGKRTKVYGGFFPFAIDSPSVRQLISGYYAHLMPELKSLPGFHVVWLMNEPTYRSQDPHYLELYRKYLRDRFQTVDALNAAWGTHYAGFDAINAPSSQESPECFDWLTFHQDQVAGWFEWLAGQVKQYYPQAVLSNKPMSWTLLSPGEGIDFEREAELWEIPGCDASRSPNSAEYAFDWQSAAMLFDFQKSVAPTKPLADHEYHYVHQPIASSDYVRAAYFQSYLHGLRMSQFWVWATGLIGKGKTGAGMEHTAWSQPKVAWGTATAALDLRRLAKYVAAFPGKPEVMLYFSRPSLYRSSDYINALSRAYQAANSLDAPVGFITDRMIRAGKLDGCKLLILPAAAYVEADVRAAVQAFAARGGYLLCIGEALAKDPYGHPYPQPFTAPAGQIARTALETAEKLVPALDQAFTAAGISRPVRVLGTDGKPAWPVECRTAVVEGKRVCYLIGLNKEPLQVTLTGAPRFSGWRDLITGAQGKGNHLTVAPLSTRLLLLEQ